MCNKISFSAISSKITVLNYMLLHMLYINMAIGNILLYLKSLCRLPAPKYQNFGNLKLRCPKNQFFGHIFKTKHFRSYVAS